MRITTKGRYALRAVVNMAMTSGGKPVPIKKISEEEEISAEFLEQICFRLKKAGLIRSVRGPGGGFLLNRPPENISMYDIFEAVGEGAEIAPCIPDCAPGEGSGAACHRKNVCCAHPTWLKLSREVLGILNGYTVKAIVEDSALNPTAARL
ncbi:MAG: Rrf2 family transcriptional regulator [Spirochaetales bacterium]|jgi:Rrf2 family iron-sulfur cluster assembly transcriptional regulator|nr:Rrf2 family transcriptional regulator [Spirochaetales bacterium]